MFEYNDLDYLSDKLKVDINKGLSSKEALKRQSVMGKNILDNKRKESVIKVILLQLKDPMIYILLVSILISLFLKEYSDSIVIGVVVIVNALIGGIQQIKTEKALEKLKQMSEHTCYVYRDGEKVEISSANLVRGDVLVLETGKSVGADCRVIEASNLKVDESSLTGESNFIKKGNIVLNKSVKNIGDKKNMCFMSSLVVSGYGKGVVTNIGMNTEIGHIAKVLKEEKKDLTPLQLKLNKLGKLLGVLTIIICLMLFVIGLASGRNLIEMILTSLSLLVAAIPEGLPAVVTIVLAIGVSRMIRVNALIRKLPSVETLGSVNVVCSDKTGTLTENKLTVSNVYENNKYIDKGNRCSDRLVRVMSLCNNAYVNNNEYIGSSIEIALLKYLHENNYEISKQERVEEKEFDSTRKMMSCVCKNEGKLDEYCKGAYDRIISLCKYIYIDNSKTLIDENIKKRLDNEINKEANMGKRLLAFAIKENVKEVEEYEMSFIGFISFFDKPREGVKEAIESFKNAGVKTVMITGDYINTAFSIGKDLGICDEENECISGENIDKLSDLELKEIIKDKTIFARVSPLHKSRIVGAFKDNGDVVAMTGDGVNDAPSLKKADIGISMGITGNDVSKEASDMILVDDNFVTIETAIEEGRTIYNNIKKAILFLLSSNLSEIIIMLIAIIFKLPLPLLAIQILIVNLLTDSIPALALGADLKEDDVMKQKSRSKKETLFSNGGARVVILYGTLIAIITFIAYLIPSLSYSKSVYGHVSLHGIKSSLAFDEIIMKAQTYSFITLSLCELFYSIVSRNVNKSVFRKDVLNNKFLNISVVSAIIISYFLVSVTKLESILGFYKVNITEYIFLVLLSASIIFLHELVYDLFHVKPKKKRKIE